MLEHDYSIAVLSADGGALFMCMMQDVAVAGMEAKILDLIPRYPELVNAKEKDGVRTMTDACMHVDTSIMHLS